MSIIDKLNPNEVQFVDRSGHILIFYCNDEIKVTKICQNINQASRELTKYRKKFENHKVG